MGEVGWDMEQEAILLDTHIHILVTHANEAHFFF